MQICEFFNGQIFTSQCFFKSVKTFTTKCSVGVSDGLSSSVAVLKGSRKRMKSVRRDSSPGNRWSSFLVSNNDRISAYSSSMDFSMRTWEFQRVAHWNSPKHRKRNQSINQPIESTLQLLNCLTCCFKDFFYSFISPLLLKYSKSFFDSSIKAYSGWRRSNESTP